jgi:putative ABC transport system permease protein
MGLDLSRVRALRKNIGFTCAVVGMLAVGIGATTAMFSIADGVLFAPLPYTNEPRLFSIVNTGTRHGENISPLDFLDIREQVKSFDEMGAFVAVPGNLTGEGEPLRIGIADVTANWFSMLGIGAEVGRVLAKGEDGPSPAKVVVISDDLWRTRFGADRAVLGHRITIDGDNYTIVGVASPQMALPYKLNVWRPFTYAPELMRPVRRGFRIFHAMARLAPGATLAGARAELHTVTARLHEQYPTPEAGLNFDLMPLREHIVGESRMALYVMFAAVCCVLLIACANVAGLLLLRARQRSSEMGIRLALGASPGRVLREMLAESVAYGVAAGAVGVVLAAGAIRVVIALRPAGLPLIDDISLDWRVLAFSVGVTLATSVLFGIAPAIFASKTDLVGSLTSGTRSTSAGRRSTLLRQTFVVLELALALVLLVGAGLLGKSFDRLMAVNLGFRPEGLVHFDLRYDWNDHGTTGVADSTARLRMFVDAVVRDLRTVPGTRMVAAGFGAPFTGPAENMSSLHIEGHAADPLERPSLTFWKSVTPGYFETIGIPLVRGRLFTDRDRAGAQKVLIVNEAFVKMFLPGEDPLGRVVTNFGEIVGVVGDTKNMSITEAGEPTMYYAFDQNPPAYVTVLIRSSADPAVVVATARKRVALLDGKLPLFDAGTYDDLVRSTASRSQLSWQLVAGFSAFALLLAAAGIYGVVAFSVRQRRREFGIRIALGAQKQEVMRLVLLHAAWLALLGVSVGLVVAFAASSALRSILYGVGATDLATYGGACAVLIVATAAASWLPAWSAGRVDPMMVMRSE